jgi:hypothetical protein
MDREVHRERSCEGTGTGYEQAASQGGRSKASLVQYGMGTSYLKAVISVARQFGSFSPRPSNLFLSCSLRIVSKLIFLLDCCCTLISRPFLD